MPSLGEVVSRRQALCPLRRLESEAECHEAAEELWGEDYPGWTIVKDKGNLPKCFIKEDEQGDMMLYYNTRESTYMSEGAQPLCKMAPLPPLYYVGALNGRCLPEDEIKTKEDCSDAGVWLDNEGELPDDTDVDGPDLVAIVKKRPCRRTGCFHKYKDTMPEERLIFGKIRCAERTRSNFTITTS